MALGWSDGAPWHLEPGDVAAAELGICLRLFGIEVRTWLPASMNMSIQQALLRRSRACLSETQARTMNKLGDAHADEITVLRPRHSPFSTIHCLDIILDLVKYEVHTAISHVSKLNMYYNI
jgi:hypothetical protein